MMTRRKFIYSSLVPAAAAAYPCYIEPRWLSVTQPPVNLQRVHLPEPVRVLHLSDLHLSWAVPLSLIENALMVGLSLRPDVTCLTGDFITGRGDFNPTAYTKVLARLADSAPAFAVLGNHDGGIWAQERGGYSDNGVVRKILEQSGIRLLHNSSAQLEIRSAPLSLVGVGDLWSDEVEAKLAFSGLDARKATVLLSHNPDSKDVLGNYPWDLMLSGHTHGGQVVMPFDGPRFAPVKDKRYVAGLGAWGSRQIHVSRGVGSIGGIRFRCRPEVNLLVIQ